VIAGSRPQVWFWLGALAAFFLALYLLSPILLPFVAGGIIAYFLDPAVTWLEHRGLPRWLATVIGLGAFILVLVLLTALILPLLRLQIGELINRLPTLFNKIQALVDQSMQFAARKLAAEDFQKLRETLSGSVGDLVNWAIHQAQAILTSGLALANLLSLVFITPVVAFFVLRDWHRIIAHIDDWLPRDQLATIREQARLVDTMLGGYIRGQLLVCLALGIFYAVALSLIGLDFGLILGILTGLIAFIPYLGYATGFVLSLGFALLQFGWGWGLVWVAAVFAVGQVLETVILVPRLVGQRVQLHPVWVIFALLAFGTLFGFLGILIALPTAAVVGVLVRFSLGRYMASPLYDTHIHDRHERLHDRHERR
jgi:predicted PurR-regulated permease PerM